MMNAIELISQDLFDKVRSRYSNLEMGDEDGNTTSDPRGARFFDFDYTVEGNNLGRVSISINERGALKIFYGQGILEDADPLTQELWFDFLKEMRNFAKRRLLRFDTRDITKANLDKNDFQYLATTGSKEDNMSESKMFGSSKSSYLPIEKTRLIIRHNGAVDETQRGARSRNISSIYIENADGERFKYPYIHLAGSKAMQRHVANGGRPYDDCGNAIIKMSEQIAQLTAFKRHVGRHDSMHAEANDIMERACMKLESLRSHVTQLSKQGHYLQWKEAFSPSGNDEGMVLDQATMEDYKSKFTVSTFAEDLAQYFPLIHSIMHETGEIELDDYVGESGHGAECKVCGQDPCECSKKKVDEFANFESWATSLAEGTLGPDTIASLKELLGSESFTLGVDGTSAIEALEGIGIRDDELNSALEQLAKVNSEADPIPTISAWVTKADPAAAQELGLAQNAEQPAGEVPAEEPAAEVPAEEDAEQGYEEARPEPSVREIAEMVKSFYDRETGNFPLGETGVITKIKKELGDRAGALAERLVRHLAAQGGNPEQQQVEPEQNEVDEAGVWDIVGKRASALGGHGHGDLDDTQKRALSRLGLGGDDKMSMTAVTPKEPTDPWEKLKLDRQRGRVNPAEEGIEDDAFGGPALTKDAYIARKKALQQIMLSPSTSRDPVLKKELFKKVAQLRKLAIAGGIIQEPDLAEVRGPLDGHPYHGKSDAELQYIIKDAGEAARAMKSINPAAEAKYLDQVNDASTVLYHRRNKNVVSESYTGHFNDDDWYEVDTSTNQVLRHAGGHSQFRSGVGQNIELPNGNVLMRGMRAKYLKPTSAPESAPTDKREFKRQELQHELGHETNNVAISINGKVWKVVPAKGNADSFEERQYLKSMQIWAEKKSASSGKRWSVSLTGAPVSEGRGVFAKKDPDHKEKEEPKDTEYSIPGAWDDEDEDLKKKKPTDKKPASEGIDNKVFNEIMKLAGLKK